MEFPSINNRCTGREAQVHCVKSKLKVRGTKRLKLEYAEVLSSFAFKFNLRRYTPGGPTVTCMPQRPP